MNEIEKLHNMLNEAGIVHEFGPRLDGHYIRVYDPNKPFESGGYDYIVDAIYFRGSYGYEEGLIEIAGYIKSDDVPDTVEGWLTAEEIFNRIMTYKEEHP